MRTSVLAMLLGLSLVACTGSISGGGGDDDVPETCGNGVVDPGEECDGSVSCTAECTEDPTATPRLDAVVDKTQAASQLMGEVTVIATLTSGGGFTGTANIAATIVDDANVPLTEVTVVGPTTVNIAPVQPSTATFVVTIPSNAAGAAMNANLKLAITSTAGNHDLTTTIAIEPRLIISYAAGTGATDTTHPVKSNAVNNTITVKRGAIIGYKNDDTIDHITHGGGVVPHEAVAAGSGLAGATYTFDTVSAAPGSTGTMGCHSHDNDAGYVNFTIE